MSSEIILQNSHIFLFGLIACVLWMSYSFFIKKKSEKSSIISGFIFALWFLIGFFIWNIINNFSNKNFSTNNMNNYNYHTSAYSRGLIATFLWFLYTLFIMKKPMDKAIISTVTFFIFYFIAELIFLLLTKQ